MDQAFVTALVTGGGLEGLIAQFRYLEIAEALAAIKTLARYLAQLGRPSLLALDLSMLDAATQAAVPLGSADKYRAFWGCMLAVRDVTFLSDLVSIWLICLHDLELASQASYIDAATGRKVDILIQLLTLTARLLLPHHGVYSLWSGDQHRTKQLLRIASTVIAAVLKANGLQLLAQVLAAAAAAKGYFASSTRQLAVAAAAILTITGLLLSDFPDDARRPQLALVTQAFDSSCLLDHYSALVLNVAPHTDDVDALSHVIGVLLGVMSGLNKDDSTPSTSNQASERAKAHQRLTSAHLRHITVGPCLQYLIGALLVQALSALDGGTNYGLTPLKIPAPEVLVQASGSIGATFALLLGAAQLLWTRFPASAPSAAGGRSHDGTQEETHMMNPQHVVKLCERCVALTCPVGGRTSTPLHGTWRLTDEDRVIIANSAMQHMHSAWALLPSRLKEGWLRRMSRTLLAALALHTSNAGNGLVTVNKTIAVLLGRYTALSRQQDGVVTLQDMHAEWSFGEHPYPLSACVPPPRELASALEAGLLPAVERQLRAIDGPTTAAELTFWLADWPLLLAHAPPAQIASVAATLRKLLNQELCKKAVPSDRYQAPMVTHLACVLANDMASLLRFVAGDADERRDHAVLQAGRQSRVEGAAAAEAASASTREPAAPPGSGARSSGSGGSNAGCSVCRVPDQLLGLLVFTAAQWVSPLSQYYMLMYMQDSGWPEAPLLPLVLHWGIHLARLAVSELTSGRAQGGTAGSAPGPSAVRHGAAAAATAWHSLLLGDMRAADLCVAILQSAQEVARTERSRVSSESVGPALELLDLLFALAPVQLQQLLLKLDKQYCLYQQVPTGRGGGRRPSLRLRPGVQALAEEQDRLQGGRFARLLATLRTLPMRSHERLKASALTQRTELTSSWPHATLRGLSLPEVMSLVSTCSNPLCENTAGCSEAVMALGSGCSCHARYCSPTCRVEHWALGHREVCLSQRAGGRL